MVLNPVLNVGTIALLGSVLVAVTVMVYWNVSERLKMPQRLFLLGCRLVAIALLLLILLQPSIQENNPLQKDSLKIGVLLDSSRSMRQDDIDGVRRIDYIRKLALENTAAKEVPLEFYTFDKSTEAVSREGIDSLSAEGRDTRFHDSLKSLFEQQTEFGMKAAVLLTDGHNLQEEDLHKTVRLAQNRHCRLFALPVGNVGKVRDLDLRMSSSQDYVFIGNKMRLSVILRARNCEYEKVKVELFSKNKKIGEKQLNLEASQEHVVDFSYTLNEAGDHAFEARVTHLDAEVDYKNNQTLSFVRGLDKKMRILLLEGEPHWDTTFLRRQLDRNSMIDLDAFVSYGRNADAQSKRRFIKITESPETVLPQTSRDFRRYDMVFVGRNVEGLLTKQQVEALENYVRDLGGILIFIRGNAFSSEKGRALQPVEWDGEGFDKVQLKASHQGRRLALLKSMQEVEDDVGPGSVPHLTLARKVATRKPLSQSLALSEDNNADETDSLIYRRYGRGQVLSFGIEGLWRWRFNKTYDNETDYYSPFWNQTVLWLVHNSEFTPGEKFTFRTDASRLELGDKIQFRLSVRHEVDIPHKDPSVDIFDSEGQQFSFLMKQDTAGPKHRFFGTFSPPQEGLYQARWKDDKGQLHEVPFLVNFSSLEEKEVGVDRQYLNELTRATGGRLLKEEDLASLEKLIDLQAQTHERDRIKVKPVWDRIWFLYIICMLMALDWYYRRRWGLC